MLLKNREYSKSYNCLANKSYVHFTVNYKMNFVDFESGTHIHTCARARAQHIECYWRKHVQIFHDMELGNNIM